MGDPTGSELVRDRLRNGHDVIVVGCDGETKVATGGAPKRARPHGAGGGSGEVGSAGGADGGSNASAASAAAAGEYGRVRPAASEVVAVRTAGGGEVDAVAAVPPLREQAAAYAAWFVGRVRATLPATLDAAWPWAEAAARRTDQRIVHGVCKGVLILC